MWFKKLSKLVYGLVIIGLLVIAITAGISQLPIPGGIKLFTVQSGSMEPAIHTGSVVIVQPTNTYQINDIITFKSEQDRDNNRPKFTTTHRLNQIIIDENGTQYQTKGDANNAPDMTPVSPDLIIGKVVFAIPWLGFPVSFARTQEGLLILIIIPAVIIIYSELVNIKNEIVAMWKKRKQPKEES